MTTTSAGSAAAIARGRTVRQGEEDDVMTGEDLRRRRLQHPVRELDEVRLMLSQGGPGVGRGGHRTHLETSVCQEQAEDLPTGVPAGTGYRRAERHAA